MNQANNDSPDVVAFDSVSIEVSGRRVLEDISFTVPAGHFVGLVGPNGAGKTTLLKAMLGLVPIAEGSIEVLGSGRGRQRRSSHSVGYVPQRNAVPDRFPATVRDVVMMGRLCCIGLLRFPNREDWAQVDRSLELVDLSKLKSRPVGQLSGGEQRRVILAQALCASTRLLILDEPTIGLDLPAEQEFYALLGQLRAELSLSIVAVSHDLVALAGEVDQLICINRRMHVHGNPDDVVHSHALREAYSCEFDFIAGELAHHDKHGSSG